MGQKALFWCVLVFVFRSALCMPTNLCPDPQDIAPCVCNFPSYYLVCNGIQDTDELRRMAVNLEGSQTEFNRLLLANSSLQYLPKELLELVKVSELYMENVTLVKVFEESPRSLDRFTFIRLIKVRLLRGVIWTVYKNMKNLKAITINDIPIPHLDDDFSQNVPHGLRQLELSGTKTKTLKLGVFNDFKNLEKISITESKLKELHRGSFPVPFNVRALYFEHNKLKSIPDDLFTQMPNLKDLNFMGNQLAAIPESAFGGRYDQIDSFYLRDNPLKCDCSLKWIVRHKPFWFDGTCSAPKIMHGKELKDLSESDFHC